MSIARTFRVVAPTLVGLSLGSFTAGATGESPSGVLIGGAVPAQLGGDSARPRLYDNTAVCTQNVHIVALGGQPPNPMSVRDWFVTAGGTASGFDLFVVNGADAAQHLDMKFYEGTNARALGHVLLDAFFRTLGAPPIDPVPPWIDPNTGVAGVIRVRVDYVALTYTLTGLTGDPVTGDAVEIPLNGENGQFLGETVGRLPLALPAGPVGVNVLLGGEPSVCNNGDPKGGPVLARGGSGNEDGFHMIAVYADGFPLANCSMSEHPLICDDAGWEPCATVPCNVDADCEAVFGPGVACGGPNATNCDGTPNSGVCAELASVPCTGGDFCVLDQPHYGIALTLYAGPDEDEDGNNEIDTADPITLDLPDPCTSGLSTFSAFLGDNGQPIGEPTPVDFFDCDGNGAVDFADFGCFQLCFGVSPQASCRIHDSDQDDDIDLNDFELFLACADDASLPECSGVLPPPVMPLQDVDIFAVGNLSPGHVLSALVTGEASPVVGPLWDPHLRLFVDTGAGVEALEFCDDYYRFSLDAFMTTIVPPGVDTIFVAVSSQANADYDPLDPATIIPLDPDDAGGYALTLAVTDPECVQDTGGPPNQCYETVHEPDDSLAAADDRGPLVNTVFRGAIGDGAFAALGQDVDIYRIELDGDPLPLTENTESLTASVKDLAGFGFQTAFDLAMALYDADGNLIAVGDQASVGGSFDQTRPQLAVNVCGSNSPTGCQNESPVPGLYYLAIFATNRQQFDLDDSDCDTSQGCPPLPVATPPTILNFPHGDGVGCTHACDIRPVVPGRVNRPGPPIVGREPPDPNVPPNGATLQCYRIVVSTSSNPVPPGGVDICELGSPNGDDSIPDACDVIDIADRLGNALPVTRTLGNGHFGGHQGDVDFYLVIGAAPGDLVSVNVGDATQPPGNADNRVRSYLALYQPDGCTFAVHDYSLEHFATNIFILDNISDELGATVVGAVPDTAIPSFAMVGIDTGNLDPSENLPFDALQPGMTLSRRFQTNVMQARPYRIAVAVMPPIASVDPATRMFAAVHRGIDDQHTEPFVSDPMQSTCARFPPVLELDPATGQVLAVLDGAPFFFTCRGPNPDCQADPDGCPIGVTANPAIAYDGDTLFVTVERCLDTPQPCSLIDHQLFRVNPDLGPGDGGFVIPGGEIALDNPTQAVITGMVERDGFLWALDATTNRVRFWDKDLPPDAGNGGTSVDLTSLSGTDPDRTEFNDLAGDLGTDGENIHVACFHDDVSVGICVFAAALSPDGRDAAFTFVGVLDDPLTNELLVPGPRLGGLDFLNPDVCVTSDRNGPIVEHWHRSADEVTALELPTGILVDRVTVR